MFENLKVVELASVLAGPLVGTFFAELGAEVIKIENKSTHGDVTRTWKLPNESPLLNFSAYYAAANYGKQSLFLDLKSESDFSHVLELIAVADILIVNFKVGDAEKLGLDALGLRAKFPQLIYAALTGFEEDDNRTAFDVVLQAETGYMFMNGEKNSKPLKMPVAFIDILAAHQLKEGILCALIQRGQTGNGAKVSVSLYDAAIASLANQATNYLMADTMPTRMGSEHPNIAPYGDLFQTVNGEWIVLAIGTDKQFADFCLVMNSSHLSESDKFNTNSKRVSHRQELYTELDSIISHRTTRELKELFQSRKIPYGRVLDIKQVFDNTEARKLIIEDEIDGYKAKRVKTVAFNLSY
jgi:crotonobetainyl-CoA:carnitine CoA-transferase CaiB-like acyl-CoA transferase